MKGENASGWMQARTHGGQRGAAQHRSRRDTGEGSPGQMLERSGPGERHRDGSHPAEDRNGDRLDRKRKGKKRFQRGLGFEERPRACQDRRKMKDAHDASGLQARARGGSGHRRGGGRSSCTRPIEGDTPTLPKTFGRRPLRTLRSVDAAPTAEDAWPNVHDRQPALCTLEAVLTRPWTTARGRSRIAEPKQKGFARWRGD